MNKIYVDKQTNMVSQIINIEVDKEWSESWYPNCYIVDDENNEITSYGYRYNLEKKEFEVVEDYEEQVIEVEPSEIEELKKANEELKAEITIIQGALDSIIRKSNALYNINNTKEKKGGDNMSPYLSMRILQGKLKYEEVVTRYPEFKDEIDFILKAEGRGDLIVDIDLVQSRSK